MPISPARRPSSAHDLIAPAHVPLAVATRGGRAESVHYGSVAVVDREGVIRYSAGDARALTFTRSALKPLQAIAFVAAGGAERFGFDERQLALLCASHSGEPRHVEAVADMLARAGNAPQDLQCGTHPPFVDESAGETPPPPPYSPLAHNCSGKHAGMLAFCALCGWPKASYLDPEHPAQRAIRGAVAHFLGIREGDLTRGVDGCSAPNYAAPLAQLGRAYARLALGNDDAMYGDVPRRLARAMRAHPEMVSGVGRSDLALMSAGRGDWVAKVGAEGVQAIGIRSAGLGIAIKIADGAKRALMPATIAVLDGAGLLDAEQRRMLGAWREPELRNARGIPTGRVVPVLALESVGKLALDQNLSPAGDRG